MLTGRSCSKLTLSLMVEEKYLRLKGLELVARDFKVTGDVFQSLTIKIYSPATRKKKRLIFLKVIISSQYKLHFL